MAKNTKFDLFVPGRLCIIGEHSDWAGIHRMTNAGIIPGQAIVTGIEQGIYATVERDDRFIVESSLSMYNGESLCSEMDTEKLLEVAYKGGFFSYVAGVASYINENYHVEGLKITITKMNLPIKSGLSSSAAICVLVARAFNRMYNLHLNTMGEMRVAYNGEQRTPSRCGRLDQACAYGVNPVRMYFDGTEVSVKTLTVRKPLYFVVANLGASKDTVKILADLNKCFPFAQNEVEKNVQEALGKDNEIFIEKACKAIEKGDAEILGKIMIDFQNNFDRKVAPACLDQLSAPVLHEVLNDKTIKSLSYGAKGVGSQGDGTVQFLAKDEDSQKAIIDYLRDSKHMEGFPLTLKPKKAVRKAIIPVAGFGTRLFPATKAIKKDFFPILDTDGILKPVLLILLEQLAEADIQNICLVIGEEERPLYDMFFSRLSSENYDKLSPEKKQYQNLLMNLANRITYVYQKERRGFGHAVFQCRDFTEDEPVLLLLGDMIYRSNTSINCMQQMIDAYENCGMPMISMHTVSLDDVVHYGIMHGEWENSDQRVLKLDEIKEKPTVDYAKEYLNVPTKNSDENYYAVFGQYILTKEVFDHLEKNIKNNCLENGEIQLTTALEQTRVDNGMVGFVVDGKSYDVGLPSEYVKTVWEYSSVTGNSAK